MCGLQQKVQPLHVKSICNDEGLDAAYMALFSDTFTHTKHTKLYKNYLHEILKAFESAMFKDQNQKSEGMK